MRLFVDRAQAVFPTFALSPHNAVTIAAICRRLDGLPLAIELAAARVQLLTVEQIADRLDHALRLLTHGATDSSPRHHTLRATLDWTYHFLTAPEQALLRRLSVFAGSFTLDMVEAICRDEVETPSLLDRLTSLANFSFITVLPRGHEHEARYRLLETIRQYAREQLDTFGETDFYARRQLEWCTTLAERAEPELRGATQAAWFERFEEDLDNLRAALGWAQTHQQVELGLRLAGALERFWWVRGHFTAGRRSLDWFLSAANDQADDHLKAIRARALFAAGVLAYRQNDYATAEADFASSLALRQALDDRAGVAFCLNNLGNVALDQGDYTRATQLYEQGLTLRRELNDTWGIASSLNNLGSAAADQGDHQRAIAAYTESLTLYRQLGDQWSIASTLNNLGETARQLGDWPRARKLFQENLAVRRALGDKRGIALALNNLAALALDQADWPQARELLVDSLKLFDSVSNKDGLAMCLDGLAVVENALDRPERAAKLLAAATALREAIHVPRPPVEQAEHDATLTKVQARLDEQTLALIWAEGRALTLEAAIAAALDTGTVELRETIEITNDRAPELRIHALGTTRVIVGERLLTSSDWTYTKAKELLYYLVSQPPVSKAQIGLDLWPDASEHQLRNIFHRTLYYLRQALTKPDLGRVCGRRLHLQSRTPLLVRRRLFQHSCESG